MTPDSRMRPSGRIPTNAEASTTCAFVLAAVLTLFSATAEAQKNSLQPNLRVGIRYDSNLRYELDGSEVDGAQGLIIDFSLPYQHRAQNWSTSLNPRMVRSFYRKEENADLEDEDYYLQGNSNRSFRRSSIGAGYGYTNLSLRTSEFEDPGVQEPGQPPGSGIICDDGSNPIPGLRPCQLIIAEDKQTSLYVAPYWQMQLSQIDSVSANASYRKTRYDTESRTTLADSDIRNVSASYQRSLNRKHRVGISGNLSRYESENEDFFLENDSTSNSLSLIYEYVISERATLSTNLGWARTKNTLTRPNVFFPDPGVFLCDPQQFLCKDEFESDNFVGNASWGLESETQSYRIVVGQQITPNSNGAQTLQFSVNLLMEKTFTRHLSGRVGLLAYNQSNVGDERFDFSRDYVRPTIGMTYQLSRKWGLFVTYQYTWTRQNSASFSGSEIRNERTSRNHFLSAGVQFDGDGWRW